MTGRTSPLGKTTTLTYTPDGDLATKITARGNAAPDPATGTITYRHDPLGRLTTVIYGDGATGLNYAYDKTGRPGHHQCGYLRGLLLPVQFLSQPVRTPIGRWDSAQVTVVHRSTGRAYGDQARLG